MVSVHHFPFVMYQVTIDILSSLSPHIAFVSDWSTMQSRSMPVFNAAR